MFTFDLHLCSCLGLTFRAGGRLGRVFAAAACLAGCFGQGRLVWDAWVRVGAVWGWGRSGQAFPSWPRPTRDAILQPKPEIRPSLQVLERAADRDADWEA